MLRILIVALVLLVAAMLMLPRPHGGRLRPHEPPAAGASPSGTP